MRRLFRLCSSTFLTDSAASSALFFLVHVAFFWGSLVMKCVENMGITFLLAQLGLDKE